MLEEPKMDFRPSSLSDPKGDFFEERDAKGDSVAATEPKGLGRVLPAADPATLPKLDCPNGLLFICWPKLD